MSKKFIFITIFEGVEAKNILRTKILINLLEDKSVNIVLFTKSAERISFYKKEFNDPRIFYEVVLKPKVKGLDRFFSLLKFTLLRTETMQLRRFMAFEENGNYLAYYFGSFLSWLLARRLIRNLVRRLDFLLVKNSAYDIYFEKYKPSLVFLAHLFDEPEIHLLRAAKKYNVRSIGFVNSWDKVTARCIMRLLPDKAIVFNEIVKQEMIKHNDMPPQDIFVSGLPQYDFYFDRKISSKDKFFSKINVDPSKKLAVYAPMGSAFSSSDWDIIDLLHSLNSENRFKPKIDFLVRFQPNDFIDSEELTKRPWLKYDYPGIRFSASRGVDWDMNGNDLTHLKDTLYYSSLVICYASSISIDAAIFGKPVINLNFEINKTHNLAKSPTQFYKMTHYKNALETGGIKLVNNVDELIGAVNNYLQNPGLDQEKRSLLVKEQCEFLDGKASFRISEFILNYAKI